MLIYIKNKVINTDKIIAAEYANANYEVVVYLEAPTSVSKINIPANEEEAKQILISLVNKTA